MELGELLQLLKRRRHTLLRCVLLVPLAAWLVMALLPNEYTSTALIGVGRPAWQPKELAESGGRVGSGDVPTQETLITTTTVLAAAIESLQLTRGDLDRAKQQSSWAWRTLRQWRPQAAPDTPLAPRDLGARIKVKNLLNTALMGVSVSWPDAEAAARITNAIAGTYTERNRIEDAREATTTRQYLETQAHEAEAALAKAEGALAAFKRRSGPLVGGDPAAVAAQVTDLRQRSQEAEAMLAEAQSRANHLRTALAERERQMRQSLDPRASREQDAYYQALRQRYSEAKVEAASLAAKSGSLGAALAQSQSLLAKAPELERELTTLSSDVALKREAYQSLQTQLRQVRMAEAAKIGTARLVEPATVPTGPSSPARGINTILAMVSGLLLGVIWSAIQEYSDPKFRSADDATDLLDLPMLGQVPPLAALPAAKGGPPTTALAVWQDPMGDDAEAFRLLRGSLRHLQGPQALLVISPGVGEGKTTVSINLAVGMAQIGRRVLLIDADLHRPNLHRHLGIGATPGLSDLLRAEVADQAAFAQAIASCLQSVPTYESLAVIPGGSRSSNPGDLLESPRLAHLLTTLRPDYDLIVLDGPPALAYADALALGGHVDGAILVIDQQKTPRKAAAQVLASLRQARVPVLGMVVNRSKPTTGAKYGRYERSERPSGSAEVSG